MLYYRFRFFKFGNKACCCFLFYILKAIKRVNENKTTKRYFCTGTAIITLCTHFWYISTLKRSLIGIMRGKKTEGRKKLS